MKNIKWIGIVDDLSKYQKKELPHGAVKIDMPCTAGEMMIKALPCAIPSFLIIFLSMFIKTYTAGKPVVSPAFAVIGFLAGTVMLIPHELLHAVVYPKEAEVFIGIYPKAFSAVALASYPLSKSRFILMSLLPYVLGIVPIVVFRLSPAEFAELNGLMFGMSIMGLISPYPDLYNVIMAIKASPGKCRLQFYGDELYYITD